MSLPHVIRVERNPARKGCSDEWTATLESDRSARKGIGRNRTEAIGTLVRANLEKFQVDQINDIDPESDTPLVIWKSSLPGPIDGAKADLIVKDEANKIPKPPSMMMELSKVVGDVQFGFGPRTSRDYF